MGQKKKNAVRKGFSVSGPRDRHGKMRRRKEQGDWTKQQAAWGKWGGRLLAVALGGERCLKMILRM